MNDGDILHELRGIRGDANITAAQMHERINGLTVQMVKLQGTVESRPCPSHLARMDEIDGRVAGLEANQRHALIGWGVASMGVAALATAVWEWVRRKFGF